MSRNLGDVLHYFIPEAGSDTERGRAGPAAPAPDGSGPGAAQADPTPAAPSDGAEGTDPDGGAASPAAAQDARIVAVPIESADVLRAAFVWNLAIEIVRLDAAATVVAANTPESGALWSQPGRGPLGAELVLADASDAAGLHRAALRARAGHDRRPGLVLACAPRAWLLADGVPPPLLRWLLLLCSPDPDELEGAHDLARRLGHRTADGRLGVTIHGVRGIPQAQAAFERLAARSERELGTCWTSYGLLVDDLHVYRAIVAQRPIGLAHPQSPAARALRDVARLLLEDAREPADD